MLAFVGKKPTLDEDRSTVKEGSISWVAFLVPQERKAEQKEFL